MFLAFLTAIVTTLVLQVLSTMATFVCIAVDMLRHPLTFRLPRRTPPVCRVVTETVPLASPVPLTTVSFGVPVSWEILESASGIREPARPIEDWIDDRTLALLDTLDGGTAARPSSRTLHFPGR